MAKFNRIAVLDFNFSNEFLNSVQNHSNRPIALVNSTVELSEHAISDVDVLVCSWKDTVDINLLLQMPNLQLISTRATSTKNIDLEYCEMSNVSVKNIEGYGDQSTAEFVLQQIFAIARDMKLDGVVSEVKGKTVGFLGFGNVAKKVAPPLQALGANLSYYTPSEEVTQSDRNGVSFATKKKILQCDYLSIHTPDRTESISEKDLQGLGEETSVIITTMGLPFNGDSFRSWKKTAPNIVVMDKVAAGNENFDNLSNVYVTDVYAARSVESKREAEMQVIENINVFHGL